MSMWAPAEEIEKTAKAHPVVYALIAVPVYSRLQPPSASDLAPFSKVADMCLDAATSFSCGIDASMDGGSVDDEPLEDSSSGLEAHSIRRRRRRRRGARGSTVETDESHVTQIDAHEESRLRAAPRRVAPSGTGMGREFCEQIKEQLEKGGAAKDAALKTWVQGSMQSLSCDVDGCRVAQKALSVCSSRDAAELAAELDVLRTVACPHGNYVIQQAIDALQVADMVKLMSNLVGEAGRMSTHRFGCRVMCRVIERGATSSHAVIDSLLDKAMVEVDRLCKHVYGRHVMEAILEHGPPRHAQRIAATLCNGISGYATNRYGTRVIEKALIHCAADDQAAVAESALNHPSGLLALAEHQFGVYVFKALLHVSGEVSVRARNFVAQEAHRLASDLVIAAGVSPARVSVGAIGGAFGGA